jgi:hypothetical protein
MAWKILKQFNLTSSTVWVEKLTAEDTVEQFTTKKAATARIVELQEQHTGREFKVVKT